MPIEVPCSNPNCGLPMRRAPYRLRRSRLPVCSRTCQAVVFRMTEHPRQDGGHLRNGIWYAKLEHDDPSFGLGDRRGFYPLHLIVSERLLRRRLTVTERVRFLSQNRQDCRPENLLLSLPDSFLLLRDLAQPAVA